MMNLKKSIAILVSLLLFCTVASAEVGYCVVNNSTKQVRIWVNNSSSNDVIVDPGVRNSDTCLFSNMNNVGETVKVGVSIYQNNGKSADYTMGSFIVNSSGTLNWDTSTANSSTSSSAPPNGSSVKLSATVKTFNVHDSARVQLTVDDV